MQRPTDRRCQSPTPRTVGAEAVRLCSYVIEHDYGFAPNPFFSVCTLAGCKPVIRRTANVGDLIIGTGKLHSGYEQRMIYWMRVSEITTFEKYWEDPRFRIKRPDMAAPGKKARFGDNIYRRDPATGQLVQVYSFHSNPDGTTHARNYKRDTGTTENVLIGQEFAYFGLAAPEIPEGLRYVIKKYSGHKCFTGARAHAFEDWALAQPGRNFIGKPTHWATLP